MNNGCLGISVIYLYMDPFMLVLSQTVTTYHFIVTDPEHWGTLFRLNVFYIVLYFIILIDIKLTSFVDRSHSYFTTGLKLLPVL